MRELLTLTALEFGGERLSVERFDLTELIASVISSSGVLLKQNELTVDFDGKEPVYVMGDEFKNRGSHHQLSDERDSSCGRRGEEDSDPD